MSLVVLPFYLESHLRYCERLTCDTTKVPTPSVFEGGGVDRAPRLSTFSKGHASRGQKSKGRRRSTEHTSILERCAILEKGRDF